MPLKSDNDDQVLKSASDRRQEVRVMTLVFTNMVGSTQLKEQLGTPEALALIEQHHTKLRALLHTFPEAVEVETAGDSFFLAFTRPSCPWAS